MTTMSRRTMLLASGALAVPGMASAAPGKMTLAFTRTRRPGRAIAQSLEGWARAGIKHVELTNTLLDEFLKTDSLAAARRVLTDLGLTPVHARDRRGRHLGTEPESRRRARESEETLRDVRQPGRDPRLFAHRRRPQKFTEDDYKSGPANMHEAGEMAKQFSMTLMARVHAHVDVHLHAADAAQDDARGGASEPVDPLLDCYHFWSGLNKLEDLDLLQPGEIGHVHFQDVPDIPRELLDYDHAVHSGRRRQSTDTDSAQARRKGIRGPALGGAVPAEIPAGRSVRGGPGNPSEGGSGDAPGAGDLTVMAQPALKRL